MFYVLNVPGFETTWVLDITTYDVLGVPTWHERAWYDETLGTFSRHRAEAHQYFLNKHIVADYDTGALYFYDFESYSDNNNIIKRVRMTPHVSNGGRRIFYDRLQFDFKVGVGSPTVPNPSVMLEYSNDGGNTWVNTLTRSAGAIGTFGTRVVFNQLGMARDRVFRLTLTDPVDWAVSGAEIDITPADS
jgi:hypothetical protein